jgi:hypothetical protein
MFDLTIPTPSIKVPLSARLSRSFHHLTSHIAVANRTFSDVLLLERHPITSEGKEVSNATSGSDWLHDNTYLALSFHFRSVPFRSVLWILPVSSTDCAIDRCSRITWSATFLGT